jgi:CubicO group peptidase (beta-lactamase class C family)
MRDDIAARVSKAIEEKVFPGCVIGTVRSSNEREVMPFGNFTYEKGAPKVTENTIYDLASVTKSIPVAALAALFTAEGRLPLSEPVKTYIPELQNDFGATVQDLLRYRVRGAQLSTLKYTTFEQIRTHIFEQGFAAPPGESEYANLPAFLLGIVLERVGGEILPALAHKYFFGPLKMNDTTFFPHDIERVAPTEVVDGVKVRGIVHDESARMFALKRRAVGHAGLFSTAPDLLNFLEALLQGKFPAVVEAAEQGLGWQLMAKDAFGKTGFTGTSVLVDRQKGIALVILSNRTYPKRPAGASAINSFRADIAEIVLG